MAEWLRQGPAKPCTRVRFPLPPRGRLAQRESASLTRKRPLVQSQYRPPEFSQLNRLVGTYGHCDLLSQCPILGARWEPILVAGPRRAARSESRAGIIERGDSRARSLSDASQRSWSMAFRPLRMAGLMCP